MLKYYLDKTGKVIKSILFPSSEFVDTEPREGSLNPVTSGGVSAGFGDMIATMLRLISWFQNNFGSRCFLFKFSKLDYSPEDAGVGTGGTWTKVPVDEANLWIWRGGTTVANAFINAFRSDDNEVIIVHAGSFSAVTSLQSCFKGCTSLIRCSDIATGTSLTNISEMFYGCTRLESLPAISDVSRVVDMTGFASKCKSVKKLLSYNFTVRLTTCTGAFEDCTDVDSGALQIYQALDSLGSVTAHSDCFKNCGINTPSGRAELAQIPASWGGTAP